MTRPNFFIVGAPKSGTTAMAHYLRQHPDVFMPPGKEFHHFGSDLQMEGPLDPRVRDRSRYLKLFEDAADHTAVGEASVWYLYSRRAAREIHDFNPEARVIAMLRNPIDMLYSHHRQLVFNGDETITDFGDALARESDRKRGRKVPESCYFPASLYYRDIVRYASQLKRYHEVFGSDRILVLFFEDFADDTAAAYRRTLDFLDVDASFQPAFRPVNPSAEVRSRWLRSIVRDPPALLRRGIEWLNRWFPNLLHRRLRPLYLWLNSRTSSRTPMDPELRERLRQEFEPERRRVARLLDREPDW